MSAQPPNRASEMPQHGRAHASPTKEHSSNSAPAPPAHASATPSPEPPTSSPPKQSLSPPRQPHLDSHTGSTSKPASENTLSFRNPRTLAIAAASTRTSAAGSAIVNLSAPLADGSTQQPPLPAQETAQQGLTDQELMKILRDPAEMDREELLAYRKLLGCDTTEYKSVPFDGYPDIEYEEQGYFTDSEEDEDEGKEQEPPYQPLTDEELMKLMRDPRKMDREELIAHMKLFGLDTTERETVPWDGMPDLDHELDGYKDGNSEEDEDEDEEEEEEENEGKGKEIYREQ